MLEMFTVLLGPVVLIILLFWAFMVRSRNNSIVNMFRKAFEISGRSARNAIVPYYLTVILCIGLFFIGEIIISRLTRGDIPIITWKACIGSLIAAMIIPTFALFVRRLHDLNMSGWWLLATFTPFIGGLFAIVILSIKGNNGPNRFGLEAHLAKYDEMQREVQKTSEQMKKEQAKIARKKENQLEVLTKLKEKGILTDEEFENEKSKVESVSQYESKAVRNIHGLLKIKELYDSGALPEDIYNTEKAKMLGRE